MELRSPRTKKKDESVAKIKMWGRMLRTPLLIVFLMGTISCDNPELSIDNELPVENVLELSLNSNSSIPTDLLTRRNGDARWRHQHVNLSDSSHHNRHFRAVLSDIRYLRRHLNKQIVNFVMTDTLVDGESENRVHYNGITAKETYVGADGKGLRLRQLTDGRHLVQLIYAQDGDIQDCEYITQAKRARHFLKTLRQELKRALDELNDNILEQEHKIHRSGDDDRFLHNFNNVTFKLLKDGEGLPPEVAAWLNYDELKTECLRRHEEMTMMMENRNKVSDYSMSRSRRSLREHFIVPGTKWCGAGQLAETYNELGTDRSEDKCCRAHDHCRVNIGAFTRRFGYLNLTPFTVSHCRCDRRFRSCLKLADTSVSNMVGKLFFNVVQTKCFVLKPVKVCTQRSWWGKCLKRGYTKQAFLRENLPY